MERGNKKSWKNDRNIQIAILVISLLILVLTFINFIGQGNINDLLRSIARNTYSPNPYLNINANCYTMEQDLVQKYFGDSANYAGYVDVFELDVTNTLGTNPWIKITLPKGLYPTNITSIPEANIERSRDEYEKDREVISIQWEKEIGPATDAVRLIVLYDKNDLDKLENQIRVYSYGISESGESRNSVGCYNIKIFTDFK